MKKALIFVLFLIIFATVGCSGKQYNIDINRKDDFTETIVEAKEDSDINTVFQQSEDYRPTTAIPADAVLAYGTSPATVDTLVKSWLNKGYQQVNLMIPIGRDQSGYYVDGRFDGQKHREIIQISSRGAPKTHPMSDPGTSTYYICPNDGFCKYLAEFAMKAIRAGAQDIFLEEPDFFISSGYSESFKAFYEEYYGEEWVDATESEEDRLKTNQAMGAAFTVAYEKVADYIKNGIPDAKEAYLRNGFPDSKVYVAAHSSSNCLYADISANSFASTDLSNIDGIIGQAWSDTSLVAKFNLFGKNGIHAFEYSYLEYSELMNYTRLNQKDFFSLADPMSDSGANTEELLQEVYKENIVAQLINPNINKFELLPWPQRAYEAVSYNYKGLQETMFRLCNDAHGQIAVQYAGMKGVGVVTSYTNHSNGNKDFEKVQATNNFTGIAATLLSLGIPIEVLSLEGMYDINYLKGIDTLILSYDSIKPENPVYNEVIAQFVKNGGNLIYIGGYNKTQNLELWWKEYGSPQQHLFKLLGADVNNTSVIEAGNLKCVVDSNYMGNAVIDSLQTVTGYQIGKKANPLYKIGDNVVAFEQKIGKGLLTVCGLDGAYYSSEAESYKVLESLVMHSANFLGKEYNAPRMLRTVRGDVEIVKTFDRQYTLDGTYLNLLNLDYSVVKNPTIDKHSFGVFVKLDEKALQFANSDVYDFSENANGMSFKAMNTIGGKAQLLVYTGGANVEVDLTGAAGESNEKLVAKVIRYGDYTYITYKQEYLYTASSDFMKERSYKIGVNIKFS